MSQIENNALLPREEGDLQESGDGPQEEKCLDGRSQLMENVICQISPDNGVDLDAAFD